MALDSTSAPTSLAVDAAPVSEAESWTPPLDVYDHPSIAAQLTAEAQGGELDCALMIENLRCAGCAAKVEGLVSRLPGVSAFSLNYATHRAALTFDPKRTQLSAILQSLREAGYPAQPYNPGAHERRWTQEARARLRQLGVAAICSAQLMVVSLALYTGDSWGISSPVRELLRATAFVLCLPVMGYAAVPFLRGASRDLLSGSPGMDVPVALGIVIAFAGSVASLLTGRGEIYFDSVAMFTLFLLGARYVEFSLRRRNAAALERMSTSLPVTARRLAATGEDCDAKLTPAASLAAGERVEIRAGEVVPADGTVEAGETLADESLLTGEHKPVPKREGATLLAGSCIETGPVVMRVDRAGAACVASQIAQLADQSLANKPRISRLTGWVAQYFIAAVLLLSAGTAAWCLAYAPGRAMETVIAVLVVTCPCALSLATPSTLTACLLGLARRQVLVADANALECLARAKTFAFDKTGTLTVGAPTVTSVLPLGRLSETRARAIAGALERSSTHPVGRAIARACAQTGPGLRAARVTTTTNGGVIGEVDGEQYALGAEAFVRNWLGAGHAESNLAQDDGHTADKTASYLVDHSGPLARFEVEDAVRASSPSAISDLKHDGCAVTLLSGDREGPVRKLADALGVDAWHFGLDPFSKRAVIREMRRHHSPVVMVGDGINDAPVLAEADASVAMGTSAPISLNSASAVILKNDLRQLLELIAAAKRCQSIIRQNLAWAAAYNLLAIPAAVAGWLPPWAAAAGMSLSSLVVALNSMRAGTWPSLARIERDRASA